MKNNCFMKTTREAQDCLLEIPSFMEYACRVTPFGGGKAAQPAVQVGAMIHDHMDDLALDLQLARYQQQSRLQDFAAVLFEHKSPYHEVGKAGFIFNGDKQHPLGRTRPLPHGNHATYLHK